MNKTKIRILQLVFAAYLLGLLYVTLGNRFYHLLSRINELCQGASYGELVQRNLQWMPGYVFSVFHLSPVKSSAFLVLLKDLGGNIALFIPLGLLLPLVWPQKYARLRMVLLTALSTTLAIELIQLFGLMGSGDIDDVLSNCFGAFIGFGLFQLLKKTSLGGKPTNQVLAKP